MTHALTAAQLSRVAKFLQDHLKASEFTANEGLYGALFLFVVALVDSGVTEDAGHDAVAMMYDMALKVQKVARPAGEEKPS